MDKDHLKKKEIRKEGSQQANINENVEEKDTQLNSGEIGCPTGEVQASPAVRKQHRHTAKPAEEEVEMISVPSQDYHALKEELEKSKIEACENMEGWQRERADFLNYKKRIERDQKLVTQQITADVVRKYLEILDDLERSLQHRPMEGDGEAWSDGIELIYRKLLNMLQSEGIEQIPAEKQHFDPTWHEAVTHEDSPDHQSGDIIAVLRQGYRIGDRVIRPALVRVAR